MKWQGLNELREKYLSFFESKNHTRLPSFSLIPQGDKSLLLINSGMAPLKKYFLGQAVPPNVRVGIQITQIVQIPFQNDILGKA